MDTSTAKRSSIDPRRLAKLFGYVFGGLALLALIAFVGAAEWPTLTAILWHLRNGNTIEMSGHSFPVPLLYEPEISKNGTQVDIIKYPGLLANGASVTIESTPRTMDLGAVGRWQALLSNESKKDPKSLARTSPVTVHGQKLTFVCVDLGLPGGESLLCRADGTNLLVSTGASSPDIKQTRAMLEQSK